MTTAGNRPQAPGEQGSPRNPEEPPTWTIYRCECGNDWMGYNGKYCPAGHAYRFSKVGVVEKSVLDEALLREGRQHEEADEWFARCNALEGALVQIADRGGFDRTKSGRPLEGFGCSQIAQVALKAHRASLSGRGGREQKG